MQGWRCQCGQHLAAGSGGCPTCTSGCWCSLPLLSATTWEINGKVVLPCLTAPQAAVLNTTCRNSRGFCLQCGSGIVTGETAAELASGSRQMAGLALKKRMYKRPKIGFNSLVQSQKYVTVQAHSLNIPAKFQV